MTYPYKYTMPMRKRDPEWRNQLEWMIKTYGRRTGTTKDRWRAHNGCYWFRDESDLTLFILRWS